MTALHSHTPRWHAWRDTPGMQHKLAFLQHGEIFFSPASDPIKIKTLEDALTLLPKHKLMVLCANLFDQDEFPYSTPMLLHEHAFPMVSRSGKVSACSLQDKRKKGYFVPATTWGVPASFEGIDLLKYLFGVFNMQAVSPSSLSEKVCRSLLPKYLFIHRPSYALMSDIMTGKSGGRIDEAEDIGAYHPIVYEYDVNKMYLHHSRLVPSPFNAPTYRFCLGLGSILDSATGYYLVTMEPTWRAIAPVKVDGKAPYGRFTKWLWKEEIEDCLAVGYQFISCDEGWEWEALSDFLCPWADLLYEKWSEHQTLQPLIKQMMTGLPGRFLRAPEVFSLIPAEQHIPNQDIDIQLPYDAKKGPIFCPFSLRAEYDPNYTALTPIGDYIVMQARRHLYRLMLMEHENKNRVLRSYIDCYSVTSRTTLDHVGTEVGQVKEKIYTDVMAEKNRFVGKDETGLIHAVAPGMCGKSRIRLLQRYIDGDKKGWVEREEIHKKGDENP